MKYIKNMIRKILITTSLAAVSLLASGQPGAVEILERVERNMSSENRIFESSMIINGNRTSRTITSEPMRWAIKIVYGISVACPRTGDKNA